MTRPLGVLLLLVLTLGASRAWALSGSSNIAVTNGTVSVTGQVPVANGGTGAATFTAHGVLFGNGTGAVAASAAGTSGQPLLSGGSGADGSYSALSLSGSGVTGTLGVANGGTGSASFTSSRCVRVSAGGVLVSASTDCATSITPSKQFAANMEATTSQTVFLGPAGGLDTVEAIVIVPMPAGTYGNLRCANGAIQGVGNNITITTRSGTLGSLADSSQTCTLTGSASANVTCTDVTNSVTVTANQALTIKAVTPATLTANARLGCSVDQTA